MERQAYLFCQEEPQLVPYVSEALLAPVHGVQLELRTEMMERQVYLFCKEEPKLVPDVSEALLAPVHGVQLVDRHHQLGHTQGPHQYGMLPKRVRYTMIGKTKHARKTSHPKTCFESELLAMLSRIRIETVRYISSFSKISIFLSKFSSMCIKV